MITGPSDTNRLIQQLFHPAYCPLLHTGQDVAVSVQGERNLGVAQDLLNNLWVLSVVEHQGREGPMVVRGKHWLLGWEGWSLSVLVLQALFLRAPYRL